MRGKAMERICKKLEDRGIDFSQMSALEFFAREGDWQANIYAGKVHSIEAWEINPLFKNGLKRNLPGAIIRIGDSFQMADEDRYVSKFDFIVIDNPQCLYGANNEYCEHFEAIQKIPRLLRNHGIVIFNVNFSPFDYNQHPEWKKRREQFYNLSDASNISLDFLLSFYNDFFEAMNLHVNWLFLEPRNNEYLAYMVVGANKR